VIVQSLSLYGIGRHYGLVFQDLPDGLVVLYGANEAGKSTILAGLRGILFGRVTMAERPLAVERGALGVLTVHGLDGVYQIERGLARKQPPKVTLPNGEIRSGQEALKACFPELAEVEDTLYQSVFSFQLAELTDLGSSHPGLARRLYAVGTGAGMAPAELEVRLAEAAKAIYNPDPRARNAPLNRCLKELAEARQKWREQNDGLSEYRRLVAETVRLAERVRAAEARWEQARQDKQLAQKHLSALPEHQALIELQERLTAYEGLPILTDEQTRAISAAREQVNVARARVADLQKHVAELQDAIGQLPDVTANPDNARTIRQLYLQSSGALERARQLADYRKSIVEDREQLRYLQSVIGTVWNEDHVRSAEIGQATVLEVQQWDQRMDRLLREVETLELQVEQNRRTSAARTAAYEDSSRLRFGRVLDKAELVQQREAVEQRLEQVAADEEILARVDRELERLRVMEAELAALPAAPGARNGRAAKSRRGPWWWPALLAVWIPLVVIPIWFASRSLVATAAASLAALLLWWAVYRTADVGRSPATSNAEAGRQAELEARQSAVRRQIAEQCRPLALVSIQDTSEAEVLEARARLRALRNRLEADRRAYDEVWAAWTAAETARRELDLLQTALAEARHRYEQSQAVWGKFAADRQLPKTSPRSLLQTMEHVRQYRVVTARLAEAEREIAAIRHQLADYCNAVDKALADRSSGVHEVVEELAAARVRSEEDMDPLVAYAVERLRQEIARLDEEDAIVQRREQLGAQLQRAQAELASAENELNERINELAAHYRAIGVADEQSLEERLQAEAERRDLERRAAERRFHLYGLFGGREAYERQSAVLDMATAESLQERIAECERAEQEAKQYLDDCVRAHNDAQRKLETWNDGPTALQRLWQVAHLEEEKRSLALSYAAYKVAAHIVQKARERFEREHRPRVIQLASRWLDVVTRGRYRLLTARVDAKGGSALFATDAAGREWSVLELSRGAQEQVYFALRLAAVEEYLGRGVKLPVVLDDPLVNFDADRRYAALSALAELAQKTQVIYLTCHQSVRMFAEQHPDCAVYELNGGNH
jgi:uncharacterized protein YhaN